MDISFEALIVPKSLALAILVSSNYLQGHTNIDKIYPFIKRDFFWKGTCKCVVKFIRIAKQAVNITFRNSHRVTFIWDHPEDHVTQQPVI